jgi:multicomponent Na+:H+ antiporter subunit G
MMQLLSGIFFVAGSIFVLLAGVGIVRFRDIYPRMHTAAKAPTLGILLVSVGVAIEVRSVMTSLLLVLVVVLQLIAGPVGAHLIGRSVYHRLRPPLDGIDELAARRASDTDPQIDSGE